jgi:hypothetical protein
MREAARADLREARRAPHVLEVLRAVALSPVTIGLLSLVCVVVAAMRRDVPPGEGFGPKVEQPVDSASLEWRAVGTRPGEREPGFRESREK